MFDVGQQVLARTVDNKSWEQAVVVALPDKEGGDYMVKFPTYKNPTARSAKRLKELPDAQRSDAESDPVSGQGATPSTPGARTTDDDVAV